MVLKEVKIQNFKSYYGDNNIFKFNPDGLTLIVGDNGDGKTTFLEALSWLLDTTGRKQIGDMNYISEMRKSQMIEGEIDKMSVSIVFDHDFSEKEVSRTLSFKKVGPDNFIPLKRDFEGYQFDGIERTPTSADYLLINCFDAELRKYSMFQGESELDIFAKDNEALKILVEKFSEIRLLEKYSDITEKLVDISRKAHTKELTKDAKIKREVEKLKKDLDKNSVDIQSALNDKQQAQKEADYYQKKINSLVDYSDIRDQLDVLDNRIESLNQQAIQERGRAIHNYNTALLEKFWILAPYSKILNSFQEKASKWVTQKIQDDQQFSFEQGKKRQEEEMLSEGVVKLPWYLPDDNTMREMIEDETCKVCGRKAPKGSEAYEFMRQKLNEYLKQVKLNKDNSKPKSLFKYKYIDNLHHLSLTYSGTNALTVMNMPTIIKEQIDVYDAARVRLQKILDNIDETVEAKSRIIAQLNGVSESELRKTAQDIKSFILAVQKANLTIGKAEASLTRLKIEKEDIDNKLAQLSPSSKEAVKYERIYSILKHIHNAFMSAKDTNSNNLVEHLAELSNEYFERLSVSDFHGIISIHKTSNDDIEIKLLDSNDKLVNHPSESQKSTMYISVLFAIAQLTAEKKETKYPLIFDAPTSSFSEMKEKEFYEVINGLDKQSIIITKDMLYYDEHLKVSKLKEEAYKLSCPIYQISKAEGFDRNDLSTIKTNIIKIKD